MNAATNPTHIYVLEGYYIPERPHNHAPRMDCLCWMESYRTEADATKKAAHLDTQGYKMNNRRRYIVREIAIEDVPDSEIPHLPVEILDAIC